MPIIIPCGDSSCLTSQKSKQREWFIKVFLVVKMRKHKPKTQNSWKTDIQLYVKEVICLSVCQGHLYVSISVVCLRTVLKLYFTLGGSEEQGASTSFHFFVCTNKTIQHAQNHIVFIVSNFVTVTLFFFQMIHMFLRSEWRRWIWRPSAGAVVFSHHQLGLDMLVFSEHWNALCLSVCCFYFRGSCLSCSYVGWHICHYLQATSCAAHKRSEFNEL